ncbi:MAG: DEAD/DEAH box helicase [Myxococcales bacterium]|nr:DEAD/DEAH box helicase [Myxococcales bacterium]
MEAGHRRALTLRSAAMVTLAYVAGTIEVRGLPEVAPVLPAACRWDPRTACHRAPALAYADIVLALRREKIDCEDNARRYELLGTGARVHREARPYQTEALAAWQKRRGRGVVVLPTGAGKSHLAVMAIDLTRRSTLVIAPTLVLVHQWYDLLRTTFATPVGVIGGRDYQVLPLTVTTYDSAHLHMENLGARFGLIVFDEVHHLPGPAYGLAARLSLAPYRLGLTATPERVDGRDADIDDLCGPIVYRKDIVEMTGDYLAEYETVRLIVELSPAERAEHDAERAIYRNFVEQQGIRMASPTGWSDFIMRSSRTALGRRAMAAYRRQREIGFAAPAKLDYVAHLLHAHRRDRAILFTQDNATAYAISRRFLIPAITHQTRVRERSEILARISDGTYSAVVTSKVLNEGVDVPDANVAIVISGSGTVREHVQRLGRVLRKRGEKRATLYELVTAGTSETYTSERRREHSAYR